MGSDWDRYLEPLSDLSQARRTRLRETAQSPSGSEAERSLKHLLEESPDEAGLRFRLAKLYMLQERYFYARKEIESLLNTDSNNPGLILEHGTCLAHTDREEEAFAAYNQCIALASETAAPYSRIAELYRSSQRYPECLERTREWQRSFPEQTFPFLERARTCLAMGDCEKAISTLHTCLGRPRPYEDLVEIHYLWGLSAYRWSRRVDGAERALYRIQAREHFEKVLGLEPDYPGVAGRLEDLKSR
jgi:tetratricopeptide (TPR) repeat protein